MISFLASQLNIRGYVRNKKDRRLESRHILYMLSAESFCFGKINWGKTIQFVVNYIINKLFNDSLDM